MTPLERLRWHLSGQVAYWAHEYDDPNEAALQPLTLAFISFYSFYAAFALGDEGIGLAASLFLAFFGGVFFYGTSVLTAAAVVYYWERTEVRATESW
ncbi:hypothetical protein BRD02_01575 [Halobacteriales archaeon QS_8_69_73]|nr:MAG: hypothetical protein BRD02_01575 [Halobacteriales archaeon QS_8_69_73]